MCRAWPARGSRSAGIRCEIRASCRGRGEMGAESGRRRGRGALSLGRGRSGSWALCGVRPASAPAARPEGSAGPWGAPPPPRSCRAWAPWGLEVSGKTARKIPERLLQEGRCSVGRLQETSLLPRSKIPGERGMLGSPGVRIS